MIEINLETLKYVGKQTLKIFKDYDIKNAWDLINVKPKYVFYDLKPFRPLYKERQTFEGVILSDKTSYKKKVHVFTFFVASHDQTIKVIAFNMPFLIHQVHTLDEVVLTGVYQNNQTFILESLVLKKDFQSIKVTYLLPMIKDKIMTKIIQQIIDQIDDQDTFNISPSLINTYQLLSLEETYRFLHVPTSIKQIDRAMHTLKHVEAIMFYEEMKRIDENKELKIPRKYHLESVKKMISTLPFELTKDQKKAVNDIFMDFQKNQSVSRLLLGDVGSGKTVVAAIASYGLKTVHKQTVMMAPTVLLAQQHYESMKVLSKDLEVGLLIGGSPNKEILTKIKDGTFDLIIGTQALLSDHIVFHDLGMIIIDEQHKFGVNDRKKLIDKSNDKDILYLSATPIPRTLFLTLFGRKELSIIQTKPNHRIPVETILFKDFTDIVEDIKLTRSKGENIFIVVPAIFQNEHLYGIETVLNMIEEFQSLKHVLVLHGELEKQEQTRIMNQFKDNKGTILVATTMIEVGIDVKHATRMIIMQSNRFGLSQLHQLRGRVGRSHLKSVCYIQVSSYHDEKSLMFKNTQDGFELSIFDLKDRGPGYYLGLQQSGVPKFKWIDYADDYEILGSVCKSII